MTDHPHGTRNRRQAGCDCKPCRRANARYCKAYRVRISVDPGSVGVSTTRAAAHIADLHRQGMSYQAIAAAAGLGPSTVKRMGEQRKAKREIVTRILAVTVTTPAGNHYVPALGTRRRIESMRAWGVSQAEITRHTGVAKSGLAEILSGARPRVQSTTAERVRTMFDQVCMTPPVGRDRYERAAIARNKSLATRLGYAVPWAWDDIDDPDEVPHMDAPPVDEIDPVLVERLVSGDRVEVPREDRDVVVGELARRGLSDPHIADLLGIWPESVMRARRRQHIPSTWRAAS